MSTRTTTEHGTSSVKILGLNSEALPPEFYALAKANEASWLPYHTIEELERRAHTTGLIITPAEGTPQAMMLTQLDTYPSGLQQLTVIWTGGSSKQHHVHALTAAAERLAKVCDCTRIQVSACANLYRQMKLEGFSPQSVTLTKDI